MKWENVEWSQWYDERHPLKSESLIDEFEELCGYKFPISFRECVKKHNGGCTVNNCFPIEDGDITGLDNLLSFNKDVVSTVWSAWEAHQIWLEDAIYGGDEDEICACENIVNRYVSFADLACGDEAAFDKKDDSVVFIDHETLEVAHIADSFDEFIDTLCEYKEQDEV